MTLTRRFPGLGGSDFSRPFSSLHARAERVRALGHCQRCFVIFTNVTLTAPPSHGNKAILLDLIT